MDSGAFGKNFSSVNYGAGGTATLLNKGRAAMVLMGSWEYAVQQGEAPELRQEQLRIVSSICGGGAALHDVIAVGRLPFVTRRHRALRAADRWRCRAGRSISSSPPVSWKPPPSPWWSCWPGVCVRRPRGAADLCVCVCPFWGWVWHCVWGGGGRGEPDEGDAEVQVSLNRAVLLRVLGEQSLSAALMWPWVAVYGPSKLARETADDGAGGR